MKVLILEHPRIKSREHFNDIANTPLWSCLMGGYAAAALRAAGHDVTYCDAAGGGWDFERTACYVMEAAPALLGINAVYFWEHTGRLFDFIADLRRRGFGGHLNLFGFYATLAPADMLRAAPVESVAVGECEQTLMELGAALAGGRNWRTIPGLATDPATAGAVHRIPAKDPGCFPFPERPQGLSPPACVLASRGCYNHCSFCLVPPFYNCGPLWRGRSPDNIAEEIEGLMDKGYRDFYFVDPNFIGPGAAGRKRCRELLARLRPLKITFGMETRPNDLTAALLTDLRAAGLTSLLLGIESGSAAMLGRIRKGTSQVAGAQAIDLCRDAGIEPEIGFIMFLADTSLADIRENLAFLTCKGLLDRLERTANLLGHRQIVFKGTSGYAHLAAKGLLKTSGLMGFQGYVRQADPRVAWLADTAVDACHWVLRAMGDAATSVYWQRSPGPAHARLNAALVDRFHDLLEMAAGKGAHPAPEVAKAASEHHFLQAMG